MLAVKPPLFFVFNFKPSSFGYELWVLGQAQSDKKTVTSGHSLGNKYAQGRNLLETEEDEKLYYLRKIQFLH